MSDTRELTEKLRAFAAGCRASMWQSRDETIRLCDAAADEIDRLLSEKEALEKELAEARRALEPFSDIDGEGDEDFADDTSVVVNFGRTTVYTVKLGDFRAARRASHAGGGE